MFSIILMLHVLGAGVTLFVVLAALCGSLTKKGSLSSIRRNIFSVGLFELLTGILLVVSRPTIAILGTFCASGLLMLAVLYGVYYFAGKRLSSQTLMKIR